MGWLHEERTHANDTRNYPGTNGKVTLELCWSQKLLSCFYSITSIMRPRIDFTTLSQSLAATH